MKRFYVYQLRVEGSEDPFYIGKGSGRRIHDTLRCDTSSDKSSIISLARQENLEILTEIVKSNLSEIEAYTLEVELIAKYGRRCDGGILTNITKGGGGTSGWKMPDKTKQIISSKLTGIKRSNEFVQSMRSKLRGRKWTDDERQSRLEKMKPVSIDTRRKMSQSHRGVAKSEETKSKIARSLAGNSHSHTRVKTSKFGQWKRNKAWSQADFLYDVFRSLKKKNVYEFKRQLPDDLQKVDVIFNKFMNNWVPAEDPEWVEFKNQSTSITLTY